MEVYIDGIGAWGAGLRDWPHTKAVLNGEIAFTPVAAALPSPALLPPAERRRSPGTAKVAVQVAAEACAMADVDPATLPSIFASSHGDTEISDYMCRELAAGAPLSPTRFHNSVHNAASGYWTIAVGCRASTTAISAGNDSFGTGLLEAAALALTTPSPTLLVAYDLAAPPPLSTVCPIALTFGVALVLSPAKTERSLASLSLRERASQNLSVPELPEGVRKLQAGNPAARALPLLSLLAGETMAEVALPPFRWEITPCN